MAEKHITRHFASIPDGRWGARQVHYRHVGKGPVVLCLHQSPLSSRDMVATIERWKQHFTCIAPDTPGYGLSDPLGVRNADMDDFADAVVEFMDAIGVQKAAVYGFHTGAMISIALAQNHPQRVSCAAANGYVVQTEQEREDVVANYLPPLAPSWDGAHLTWLWARLREQTIFYPWYKKTLAERLDFDVPTPEVLQEALLDFMRSGDHYRVGYRAAFTMRSDLALARLQVPALVTAAKSDPLAAQLPRIRRHADCVSIHPGGDIDQTRELARDFIRQHERSKAPRLALTAPLRGRLWQQFVDVPGGQLRVRRNDDAPGRPVVVQHDAAGSSEMVHALAAGFVGRRPVIAINLPGHGDSDDTLGRGKVTVASYARAALAALDALGVRDFDFLGTWGGGMVGLELSLLAPGRLQRLVMADVMYFDDRLRRELSANYTPDIRPLWHGGHLLEAWHLLRDQGLFWPWYARTRAHVIRKPIHVDPAMVHQRVLELFRSKGAWRRAYQAHFAYPLRQKLARSRVPMLFVAPPWDPQLEASQQASRDFPQAPFRLMPADMGQWATELLPFLDA
ncbi:MAG: alpha/beta hydrolase [Steroidobacteraceae bacterium]